MHTIGLRRIPPPCLGRGPEASEGPLLRDLFEVSWKPSWSLSESSLRGLRGGSYGRLGALWGPVSAVVRPLCAVLGLPVGSGGSPQAFRGRLGTFSGLPRAPLEGGWS
eukprot:4113802-Pyramimonas_sp.AAC.1